MYLFGPCNPACPLSSLLAHAARCTREAEKGLHGRCVCTQSAAKGLHVVALAESPVARRITYLASWILSVRQRIILLPSLWCCSYLPDINIPIFCSFHGLLSRHSANRTAATELVPVPLNYWITLVLDHHIKTPAHEWPLFSTSCAIPEN